MADISYCSKAECDKKDCKRHLCNVPNNTLFCCMSDFNSENNTEENGECEGYWRINK